ncbi:MAG TPA: amidohydrolase, partial [Candidatus Angelobacter sp.]|nr:amidohydrolase [Candidatus Angelobacter sp.]
TLESFGGLELTRPTKTSVVAKLKGSRPGRVLAIRADMDALPINEENNFEFVSKNEGVMHACGHDGHTSILLGTAKVLSDLKDEIPGEIHFIFQHAEELFPGGAEEMVQAGVMDSVDQVIGLHLWSPLEVGKIEIAAGPMFAAPDEFKVTIYGKGGHAAQPHLTVDSIAIGAQVVTNLQHIVSRNVDPLDPLVLSVTQFIAGTAHNVIPGSVYLNGTVRSFKSELREEVPALMERIIKGVTEAHGATYEFNYQKGYRPVINDKEVTAKLREALVEAFGEETIQEGVPTMGAEDFSGFQQKAPGTFFMVGAGNEEKGIVYPHHHPRFTIDEDSLPMGVKAFVQAVFKIND